MDIYCICHPLTPSIVHFYHCRLGRILLHFKLFVAHNLIICFSYPLCDIPQYLAMPTVNVRPVPILKWRVTFVVRLLLAISNHMVNGILSHIYCPHYTTSGTVCILRHLTMVFACLSDCILSHC